jgi:DNA-binding PadR family transcriptional regulator
VKPHAFHILLSLAEADRHGSAIARDVERLTGGEVRLWPATLYGTLEELVDQGWIDALTDTGRHPAGQSERRRYFRLTPAGRRALEAETRRLASVVATAERRLLRPGEAR